MGNVRRLAARIPSPSPSACFIAISRAGNLVHDLNAAVDSSTYTKDMGSGVVLSSTEQETLTFQSIHIQCTGGLCCLKGNVLKTSLSQIPKYMYSNFGILLT